MSMIRIDYGLARMQARKLRNAAEECESAIRFANIVLQDVKHSWRGESEIQFERKLNDWKRQQNYIKEELRMLANAIEETAQEFKETEERLAAQARDGGGGGSW